MASSLAFPRARGLIHALNGSPSEDDDDEPAPTGESLLVCEPEFARVLAAGKREGSTLTHVLRDLWDREQAATLTRSNPLRVSGAHLAIVGHVTPRELGRAVDLNDLENGFLNRFLPVMVKRGALRPFGAERRSTAEPSAELTRIIERARDRGRVELAVDARTRWAGLYHQHAGDRPGLHGSLTARAIAHIQRVALILALGDDAPEVGLPHLAAAEALWRRSDAAWRKLYGEQMGDPIADKLLNALREAPAGLTRTQVRAAVGSNNVPADKITAALELLRSGELADRTTDTTGGRPTERWAARRNHGRDGNKGNEVATTGGHSSLPSHSSQKSTAEAVSV